MTWTAPEITRVEEPHQGPERPMVEGWLDYHRQTLLWKCTGLTGEQLVRPAAEPSTMTLLGLVRHMAEVERWWFRRRAAGMDLGELYCSDASPDGDFDDIDPTRAETDFATFTNECELSRRAAAELPLDHTFRHPRRDVDMTLRWVYLHMIEEYARHNGHADLLRERIDGVTGD
jgi:uncharacterized damage-inducible protein DinB